MVEDCHEANLARLLSAGAEGDSTIIRRMMRCLAASEGQMLGWTMTDVVESVAKKLEQNSFADALTAHRGGDRQRRLSL